ncbi:MAG: hypothetical protein AAB583_06625 [Patescibacteria group bacterium]
MSLKKFKIQKLAFFIDKRKWIIFAFFLVLIFFLFGDLLDSYFEADEWFHFTYYLPLTRKPDGFLTAIVSTIINSGPLSGGQHVVPIASLIFFLNTKFFGMNYAPYAFMSLMLHALNSFLIFLLIKILLSKTEAVKRNAFALLGGIFFALAPTPIHTITGAAPFYGQNILSVTFFILCILIYKLAFLTKTKKFIYLSIFFVFLSLFTKETSVFLFLLLPFMAIIEKRIFSFKFLLKVFTISIVVYLIFRFVIPNFNTLPQKIIDKFVEGYIPKSYTEPAKTIDTGTIVSRDLSIHKNLPGEIMFRLVTFPIKMTGTLFLPRDTALSIVKLITRIVYPVPPGGDSAESSQARLGFLYGPGNGFIIYIISLVILIFCASSIIRFIRKREVQEAQALSTGLAIIVLSALPLVAIIFSFPRWGYDIYFDSRFYYNPNVGAAIVFPFLLLGISKFVSKTLRIKKASLIAIVIFIIWLVNNMEAFGLGIKQFTQNFQPDRREVVAQLKKYLPELPQKAVFYFETDGLSAYGPSLPFQTSIPQALTVVYYDGNPLPDSFFEKPLFEGKGQGHQYYDGRGFGYYSSKKNLAEELVAEKFTTRDIYAFFYEAQKIKLRDITSEVRREMEEYLSSSKVNLDWKTFTDLSKTFSFSYPPNAQVIENEKFIEIVNSTFSLEISFSIVLQAFDLNEQLKVRDAKTISEVMPKKVFFDKFHYNDASVIIGQSKIEYLIKLDDKLIQAETYTMNAESLQILEEILGSIKLIEKT